MSIAPPLHKAVRKNQKATPPPVPEKPEGPAHAAQALAQCRPDRQSGGRETQGAGSHATQASSATDQGREPATVEEGEQGTSEAWRARDRQSGVGFSIPPQRGRWPMVRRLGWR